MAYLLMALFVLPLLLSVPSVPSVLSAPRPLSPLEMEQTRAAGRFVEAKSGVLFSLPHLRPLQSPSPCRVCVRVLDQHGVASVRCCRAVPSFLRLAACQPMAVGLLLVLLTLPRMLHPQPGGGCAGSAPCRTHRRRRV